MKPAAFHTGMMTLTRGSDIAAGTPGNTRSKSHASEDPREGHTGNEGHKRIDTRKDTKGTRAHRRGSEQKAAEPRPTGREATPARYRFNYRQPIAKASLLREGASRALRKRRGQICLMHRNLAERSDDR